MKAVNYYIIVDKIKEAPTNIGGIELNEKQNSDIRYLKGEVVSVGNKVEGIANGNIIRYDRHAGHGIEFEDKLYYVISVKDVVIIE